MKVLIYHFFPTPFVVRAIEIDSPLLFGGNSMTEKKLLHLQGLIENGQADKFYSWSSWRKVRDKVFKLDNYECQVCKAKGRYSRAVIVHHIKHLKDRPDLALDIYDAQTGERQLVSVCKSCHEALHPESMVGIEIRSEPVTVERWD